MSVESTLITQEPVVHPELGIPDGNWEPVYGETIVADLWPHYEDDADHPERNKPNLSMSYLRGVLNGAEVILGIFDESTAVYPGFVDEEAAKHSDDRYKVVDEKIVDVERPTDNWGPGTRVWPLAQALGLNFYKRETDEVTEYAVMAPMSVETMNQRWQDLGITDRKLVEFDGEIATRKTVLEHLARREFIMASDGTPSLHDRSVHWMVYTMLAPEVLDFMASNAAKALVADESAQIHEMANLETDATVMIEEMAEHPRAPITHLPKRLHSLLGLPGMASDKVNEPILAKYDGINRDWINNLLAKVEQ